MSTDIVFPQGNEEGFKSCARKLGYDEVILVYKTLEEAREHGGWLFINTPSAESARKLCVAAARKGVLSVVQAGSVQFNRFILEKTAAHALVDVEFVHKNDHTHFRRSGLDQVLCRFAARNKKMILCSFSRLLDASDRGQILGRIAQNISFCAKYKVPYLIASFAHDPLEMKGAHDLKSLMRALDQ